jgi:isopentenyldiphosphate isomerase
VNSEELLEAFDEDGNLIGLFPRRECHRNKALAHKAVHILVFNEEGSMILQKRSAKKDLYPLMWDTSVGGHLEPKETYLEAALRECGEELGITPSPLIRLYNYKMVAENETELVETYFTINNGPFKPCDEEILELRAFTLAELFSEGIEKLVSPFFLRELEEFKEFLKRRGFYESDDNRWRRDVWQRFVSHLKERKD